MARVAGARFGGFAGVRLGGFAGLLLRGREDLLDFAELPAELFFEPPAATRVG